MARFKFSLSIFRFGRLRNMKLQMKLVLSFALLSTMIGASGGSGLFFVNRIAESVGIYSEVSSPLVNETMGLVGNMQTMHIALLDALGRQDEAQIQATEANIAEHDDAAQKGFVRLRQLSVEGQLDLDIDNAVLTNEEFIGKARKMLQVHRITVAKGAEAQQQLLEFEKHRQALDDRLAALASQAEADMAEAEDGTRTLLQSGDASMAGLGDMLSETFDHAYPHVQGSYKVLIYLMRLQDISRAYIAEPNADQLLEIEKQFKKTVKRATSWLKRLKARSRTGQAKKDVAQITEDFNELEFSALFDNGLFAVYRESLEADARAEALKISLAETGRSYQSALDEIVGIARDLDKSVKESTNTGVKDALLSIGIIVALGITANLLFGVFLARGISKPLIRITAAMRRLADGDKAIVVENADQKNEIGDLARTLAVFKDNAIAMDRLREEQEEQKQRAEEEKREQMIKMADDLEANVKNGVEAITSLATEMQTTAESMSGTADQTSQLATAVAVATEQASSNVQIVASAAEELSSSVREVAREVTQSTEIAVEAEATAERTSATVQSLAEMAQNIGEVVTAIDEIRGVIGRLGQTATAIASSVEEQSATTQEIARNAQQAASGTQEVSNNISNVQTAAGETGRASGQVLAAASGLSQEAEALRGKVDDFLCQVRAA